MNLLGVRVMEKWVRCDLGPLGVHSLQGKADSQKLKSSITWMGAATVRLLAEWEEDTINTLFLASFSLLMLLLSKVMNDMVFISQQSRILPHALSFLSSSLLLSKSGGCLFCSCVNGILKVLNLTLESNFSLWVNILTYFEGHSHLFLALSCCAARQANSLVI